jgi:hypothetical protein
MPHIGKKDHENPPIDDLSINFRWIHEDHTPGHSRDAVWVRQGQINRTSRQIATGALPAAICGQTLQA